jgi:hypothetical protein
VLFDLPARKFYVFGLSFWPQDFVFLALLLIIAALALFFFTALAGRLWCGYACPQTVWTEVFIAMERWCEGDRGRRMKLDAGPWSRAKLLRKGAKHTLWIVFALWTGFTFVGFFTPIRDLAGEVATASRWAAGSGSGSLFYALATWGNAGFLREQVCKYMCPYARFQGAMFDRDTLIIAYDADARRAARRASAAWQRAGAPSVLDAVAKPTPSSAPAASPTAGCAGRRRDAPPIAAPARRSARMVQPLPKFSRSATASTAPFACRSARPASTSATACNTSASPAAPASTPATA